MSDSSCARSTLSVSTSIDRDLCKLHAGIPYRSMYVLAASATTHPWMSQAFPCRIGSSCVNPVTMTELPVPCKYPTKGMMALYWMPKSAVSGLPKASSCRYSSHDISLSSITQTPHAARITAEQYIYIFKKRRESKLCKTQQCCSCCALQQHNAHTIHAG